MSDRRFANSNANTNSNTNSNTITNSKTNSNTLRKLPEWVTGRLPSTKRSAMIDRASAQVVGTGQKVLVLFFFFDRMYISVYFI